MKEESVIDASHVKTDRSCPCLVTNGIKLSTERWRSFGTSLTNSIVFGAVVYENWHKKCMQCARTKVSIFLAPN